MSRAWMPLYVADYLADTAHLRAAESGAYLHLIMHYWQHGGLPNDDRMLAMIARMTDGEWQQCRSIVELLFQPNWKHKRVEKELAEAKARYERRAAAGRKRHAEKQSLSSPLLQQCSSNAGAVRVVVLKKEQPLPKEEVIEKEKIEEGSKDSGVPRARARSACRLPEDWEPSLADLDFAQIRLPDDRVRGEADKFRDHWRAANGPPSVKRDWSAAWRNWCRKAVEFNGGGHGISRGIGNESPHSGGHAAKAVASARRAAAAFGEVG